MGVSLWLVPPANSLIAASLFSTVQSLRCDKTDTLLSLVHFSKQSFADQNADADAWTKEYDPHVSLVYAEKKDCNDNDNELISRIDVSKLIDETSKGAKSQWVDTSGKLHECKTVLHFDIPNG
jgi:Cyclic phosphodiesterase-like protein